MGVAIECLQRDVTLGRQCLLYKAIWTVGEHRLRVRRKRDAYDFQSYAVIERWNGEEWKRVDSIPFANMSEKPGDTYVHRGARGAADPNESELADEANLIRRACMVLGIDHADLTPVSP